VMPVQAGGGWDAIASTLLNQPVEIAKCNLHSLADPEND